MTTSTVPSPRREVLKRAAGLAAAAALPGVGFSVPGSPARAQQARKTGVPERSLTVAQLVDTSVAQQDVAKDVLIGSRAAWQDINQKGGIKGVKVKHLVVEVDGSAPGLRAALAALKDNPACVVLSGTAGDQIAAQLTTALSASTFPIAHVAPWLQTARQNVGDFTFPIFSAREEQLSHALRSLGVMGVQDVGAIFSTTQDENFYRQDLEDTARTLGIGVKTFRADTELSRLGQRLTPATPAILLFFGGTPELVQFTQGLEKQQRQRYIIAMANVNLQTLTQMGVARTSSVIVTQSVPVVTAALPVVRDYRDTLQRLFDEPPAALSLAGFIAARYTFEVLSEVGADITRASALAAFQRRANVDVGGFRVSFNAQKRSASYVTQSMLGLDGRVIG